MSGGDALANQQWTAQRRVFQDSQYNAVQSLYWANQRGKRGAPTPVQSGLETPAETAVDQAQMEVEQEIREQEPDPSLLQPFTLQDQAALEVTAAEVGVNVQDHNAVQEWLAAPVQNNRAVFDMMRAYRTKVIRPEYFSLVAQLEAGLRALNNNIFSVRKELSWMAADNRQCTFACGPCRQAIIPKKGFWHAGPCPISSVSFIPAFALFQLYDRCYPWFFGNHATCDVSIILVLRLGLVHLLVHLERFAYQTSLGNCKLSAGV